MIDVKASRSLMDLPGGALGLALGAEYRRRDAELTPQTFTDLGDIIGLGYSAYDGTQKVGGRLRGIAGAGHRDARVVRRVPRRQVQGRRNRHHAEVRREVEPGRLDRAARHVRRRIPRAEPGRERRRRPGRFQYRRPIRCVALAACRHPAQHAGRLRREPVAIITTPNPDLKPEESKSYNIGIVLEPTSSTTLTFDAWRIKRTNEINQGDTEAALAAGRGVRGDNDLPGIPNSGTLLAVSVDYINSAYTQVEGFDFDINQRFDMGNAAAS